MINNVAADYQLYGNYLGQEKPCECDLDKDTLIECLAQNSSDEAIPVQIVRCIGYERECEYQRTDC
jgi:hypothetical protein